MFARVLRFSIPMMMAALMAGTGFAAEGTPEPTKTKPECTAETEHLVWPEQSERRTGVPVEICVGKRFKYKWQALTVDISELRAKAKATGNQAATGQAAEGNQTARVEKPAAGTPPSE